MPTTFSEVMKPWILYAIISMIFAGFTSVIAKTGLDGISGELGLAIRTIFVFALIVLFTIAVVPHERHLPRSRRGIFAGSVFQE